MVKFLSFFVITEPCAVIALFAVVLLWLLVSSAVTVPCEVLEVCGAVTVPCEVLAVCGMVTVPC